MCVININFFPSDDPSKVALFDTTTLSVTAAEARIKWSLSPKQNDNYDSKIQVISFIIEVQENDAAWERVNDAIRGNGYFEASELCPQFVKNLIACFLITVELSNKDKDL